MAQSSTFLFTNTEFQTEIMLIYIKPLDGPSLIDAIFYVLQWQALIDAISQRM